VGCMQDICAKAIRIETAMNTETWIILKLISDRMLIDMAERRDRWRSLVNTVINRRVP
jgi:hypothetical protein